MAETKTATTQVDLTCVKPYGDALNDGKVQLAFTLPVPYGEEAEECAKQYAKKLGLAFQIIDDISQEEFDEAYRWLLKNQPLTEDYQNFELEF